MADTQTADNAAALRALAELALHEARRAGADGADVMVERAQDFEIKVADGEVLTMTQATRKALGLRAFVGGRLGFCAATDLTPEALRRGVATAVAMAKTTAQDPCHGLVTPQDMAAGPGSARSHADFDLYDAAVAKLSVAEKRDMALGIEAAARAADRRVRKFRDSGVSTELLEACYLASDGRYDGWKSSNISAWCTPVAEQNGELQTDFWYDTQAHLADLQDLAALGAQAAGRAARMLGAQSLPSQKVPVIFEAPAAAGLLASLLPALDGDRVLRRASFLAGQLGELVAHEGLTLRDAPHQRRALGSRAIDGEGLPTAPRLLVDKGRLQQFLYDGYSARRAQTRPTASAQRSAGGLPQVGVFNLEVAAGTASEQEILRAAPRALLLTRGLGQGLNTVSGEYSRGASGLWLEHGEVVHPVQEVTVAGDYLTMLRNVDYVGSQVLRRGSVAAPMVRVAEMALGGR